MFPLWQVRLDPGTGLPVFDSAMLQRPGDAYNNFPLPADARHIATVIPQSRADLVKIFDNAGTLACVAMGVPPSEVGLSVGVRLAMDAELSDGMLRTTLQRVRLVLTRCLVDVYTALYGSQPGLDVVFPGLPSTVDHTMQELFNADVLSYAAYKEHVKGMMNIAGRDLEGVDPRRREERALIAGQKRRANNVND